MVSSITASDVNASVLSSSQGLWSGYYGARLIGQFPSLMINTINVRSICLASLAFSQPQQFH